MTNRLASVLFLCSDASRAAADAELPRTSKALTALATLIDEHLSHVDSAAFDDDRTRSPSPGATLQRTLARFRRSPRRRQRANSVIVVSNTSESAAAPDIPVAIAASMASVHVAHAIETGGSLRLAETAAAVERCRRSSWSLPGPTDGADAESLVESIEAIVQLLNTHFGGVPPLSLSADSTPRTLASPASSHDDGESTESPPPLTASTSQPNAVRLLTSSPVRVRPRSSSFNI